MSEALLTETLTYSSETLFRAATVDTIQASSCAVQVDTSRSSTTVMVTTERKFWVGCSGGDGGDGGKCGGGAVDELDAGDSDLPVGIPGGELGGSGLGGGGFGGGGLGGGGFGGGGLGGGDLTYDTHSQLVSVNEVTSNDAVFARNL